MNGTTLSNQLGITLTGNWVLPTVGTPGTIQNTYFEENGYLSTNGNIEDGSIVEAMGLVANDSSQQWERSADDDSGYFTLRNLESGKFLSGYNPPNTLTIEGTASSDMSLMDTASEKPVELSLTRELIQKTKSVHIGGAFPQKSCP